MIRAVVALAGIGLALSVSPSTLAVLLLVLGAGPAQRTRSLAGLFGGIVLGNALLLALLRVATPRALAALVDAGAEELVSAHWLDLLAAATLVVGGLLALRRAWRVRRQRAELRAEGGTAAPEVSQTPPMSPRLRRAATSPWALLGFGLTGSVFTWTGAVLLYAATRLVLDATDALVWQFALLVWLLAVVILPYLAVVWIWDRAPRAARIVRRVAGWLLGRDAVALAGWATLAAGVTFGAWTLTRLG